MFIQLDNKNFNSSSVPDTLKVAAASWIGAAVSFINSLLPLVQFAAAFMPLLYLLWKWKQEYKKSKKKKVQS